MRCVWLGETEHLSELHTPHVIPLSGDVGQMRDCFLNGVENLGHEVWFTQRVTCTSNVSSQRHEPRKVSIRPHF